ncbi:BTAD domain-containing putative transcriptional regulator [Kutzneria buriramensis]|uniref:AfsR/SARP family transcriptional regulator n=1 Tax=Kutzneria buriramensis TaxID=1045776 RepID=UPI001476D3A1|nr:BTAD domain-containing putative transcriptional regulator [Kutzneria buriramensis]
MLRLRRILQVDAEPRPLVGTAAGYRLDVHRFRSLGQSARAADKPESGALLDEALALWRGDPLMDVPSAVLHREVVPGLVEMGDVPHTATVLDRIGHSHAALGGHEQARSVWRKALEMFRAQGRDQDADRVRRQLDGVRL